MLLRGSHKFGIFIKFLVFPPLLIVDIPILAVVQMPEDSTNFLYLKEEGVPWTDLETRVRSAVEGAEYSFRSQDLQHAADSNVNVIFYDAFNPLDPVIGQSQIAGLIKKRPDSPLVVVCDPSQEKIIQTLFNSEHVYTLPRDSGARQIENLINRLESAYLIEPEQPPKALILAEKDPRLFKKGLEGFDVMSLLGRTIKPEELGQFEAHKAEFDLVLIEGKHIAGLADEVYRRFPNAQVVAVGTEADRRSASDKHITVFWIREEAPMLLRRFASDYIQPVEASPATRPGKCYFLVGPTCAGKTEAGYRVKDDPNVVFIQKYTTRPRRSDEKKGVDFQFITKERFAKMERDGKFFYTFDIQGHKYGIPSSLEQLLKRGTDAMVTLTTDVIGEIKEKLDAINPNISVPILFHADLPVLRERLLRRKAPLDEKERRMNALQASIEYFLDSRDLYKYSINTTHSTPEESARLLRSIIQWERNNSSQNYVDSVLHSVFPHDLFSRIARNEPITLTIPSDITFAYAEEKHIPQSRVACLQRQRVACHSDSYGRFGVFMEPWKRSEEDIDYREATLDLIEMSAGLESRARNSHRNFIPLSVYGKCHDSLTAFNDGLLYMLGDDFKDRNPADSIYAVTFGYAKTGGKFYRAIKLNAGDINFWQSFSQNLQRFPFKSPLGN